MERSSQLRKLTTMGMMAAVSIILVGSDTFSADSCGGVSGI